MQFSNLKGDTASWRHRDSDAATYFILRYPPCCTLPSPLPFLADVRHLLRLPVLIFFALPVLSFFALPFLARGIDGPALEAAALFLALLVFLARCRAFKAACFPSMYAVNNWPSQRAPCFFHQRFDLINARLVPKQHPQQKCCRAAFFCRLGVHRRNKQPCVRHLRNQAMVSKYLDAQKT